MDVKEKVRTVDAGAEEAAGEESVLLASLGTEVKKVRPGVTVLEALKEAEMLTSPAGVQPVIRVNGSVITEPAEHRMEPRDKVTVTWAVAGA